MFSVIVMYIQIDNSFFKFLDVYLFIKKRSEWTNIDKLLSNNLLFNTDIVLTDKAIENLCPNL